MATSLTGNWLMHALYEVMTLLTRAQALLDDDGEETLIAAQLANVIDIIELRIGAAGAPPNRADR